MALWRYIRWHQISYQVLCVSNVWKKEDKLSWSGTSIDLCYQVQTEKRICFSLDRVPKSYIKRSSDVSMLQVSRRTHLGQTQHQIFLHHLVGCWMKTEHIATNGLMAMLHQRSLKWLRTILALVMVSFPNLKYKGACYKITVTPILSFSLLFDFL